MILQNNNSRFNLFRIASCDSCVLPWRTTKKIFRVSQQRTENSIFRVNFRIGFYVITTMILQISNSGFNLFRIESFESWVCFLGEPQKKSVDCRSKEPRRAFSRVIFQIGFNVITLMILQNTTSRFNLFRIESFDGWVCYLGEPRKNLLTVAARSREEHFQSYLSNWLWHYDCNDSAKYHFQIHLTSNWKFW